MTATQACDFCKIFSARLKDSADFYFICTTPRGRTFQAACKHAFRVPMRMSWKVEAQRLTLEGCVWNLKSIFIIFVSLVVGINVQRRGRHSQRWIIVPLLRIAIARVICTGVIVATCSPGTAASQVLHQQTVQVVPNLGILHHTLHLGANVGHVPVGHDLSQSWEALIGKVMDKKIIKFRGN